MSSLVFIFKKHILHSNCGFKSDRVFFTFFLVTLLFTFFYLTEIPSINHVKAQQQSKPIFRVSVEVTNTGITDQYGTIYVNINDSPAVDGLSGQIFPARGTISFEFVFDSKEIPVGKEFVAEVVYATDIHKRVYGKNTSPNSSETVAIEIP